MGTSMEKSFRKFIFIWAGQFLSVLGSGISTFGLSVWLYDKTGAATPFAMAFLCSILPSLVFAPLAGSVADRKRRKAVIMITDSLDALLKLVLVVLLFTDIMQIWMVYPLMIVSSTLSTFQSPAFSASIPMLVEKEHLSRANGMRQLSGAVQSMLAPVLAGALYPFLHVEGLLIVDLGSYLFAIVTIAVVTVPQPKLAPEASKALWSTAIGDFVAALRYLRRLPRLLSNILVFAVVNFIANLSIILVAPMILSNYDAAIYGLFETINGVSMIVGGLVASLLPSPKNKFATIYAMLIVSGIGLIIGGLSPNWLVIAGGMILFTLFIPYVNSLTQTMLQTMVDSTMLGRVDAATGVLCQMVMPISALLAGPLADNLFGPMMAENGVLGTSLVGRLIGTGTDRGAAVVFLLCGFMLCVLCLICLLRAVGKEDPAAPVPEA